MPRAGQQPGCFSCFKGSATISDGAASAAAPAVVFTKRESKPVTIPHEQLLPYLRQHGRSILAHSTLQPGVHHFLMPGVGYMAYGFKNCGPPALGIRSPVVLGDPVADPAHWQMMAQAFLKRWPSTMFLQVSRPMAQILAGLGLYANAMGGTTDLDPATYTFSGNAKRGIRSAMSSAVKAGIEVEVLPCITPSLSAELREVDAAWLAARPPGAGRMWFLNRPPVFEDEPGVVVAAAWSKSTGDGVTTSGDRQGRTMQAWVAFDPVWDNGRVTGYYANVTRMRPDAHPGVLNLIMKTFLSRVAASQPAAAGGQKQQRLTRKQRAAAAAAAAAAAEVGSTTDLVIDVYSSSAAGSDAVSEGSAGSPRGGAPAAAAGVGGSAGADSGLAPAVSFSTASSVRLTSTSSIATTSSFSSYGAPAAAAAGAEGGTGLVTGVRMVSLGLSPLHALKDDLHHSSRFKDWLEWGFEHGEPFYPYKSLAASKAKYGGGMADGQYKDPTVQYNQTYWCHSHHIGCCVPLYDVIQWLGLTTNPAQAGVVLAAHKVKQLVKDARARRKGLTGAADEEGLGEELPSLTSTSGSAAMSGVSRANSSNSSSTGRKQQQPKQARAATAAAAAAGAGDSEEAAKPAVALVVPKSTNSGSAAPQQEHQQLQGKLADGVARKLSHQLVVVASTNPGVLV